MKTFMPRFPALVLTVCLLFAGMEVLSEEAGKKSNNATSIAVAEKQSQKSNVGSSRSGAVTIVDSMGRTVTVKRPVNKIALSHIATAEALKILDAWDMVVGRGLIADTKLYPNLDEIAMVMPGQNVYKLNYEKVFSVGTELFLAVDIPVNGFDEMVSMLEPDITVVALNFHDPSQFVINLKKLGNILGKEKEAEAYAAWFNNTLSMISAKTKSVKNKPNLFLKTGWGNVAELGTFTHELAGAAERDIISGSVNIAAKLPSIGGSIPSVDPEWLVTQKIDILIIMDYIQRGFGLDVDDNTLIKKHRRQVMDLPVFAGSEAVRNKRVYMLYPQFYATPRFIIQYAYLAKWLHPELFPDLDPKAIHQEYITRFLRLDFDVSRHGVFAYPEN